LDGLKLRSHPTWALYHGLPLVNSQFDPENNIFSWKLIFQPLFARVYGNLLASKNGALLMGIPLETKV